MLSETKQKKSLASYYLIYSGVFVLLSIILVAILLANGKTNINSTSDGMNQHYRALLYYSNYLKEIFSNLFAGKIVIPLWDHSIGEGADIIDILHGYGVGDPIAFLAVFVPERYMYIFYFFNALIRMYLAGLFFSMLCLYKKIENHYGILSGALVYAFCFWALQSFTLHIYFLTPLMFMPLYILSLEMIIEENRPHLFVLTVAVSAMCWMYFFYMEALAVAIYGVLRVLLLYRKELFKGIKLLFIILSYAIFGVLMAAIILLPVILAYTSDSRLAIQRSIPLLYPAFFYERLFTVFVANDFPYDLYMGFASATLFCIAVLFKEFKKHILLVLIFVLGFICVCLPIGGKIFNGFSYVSQRWSFVIALPVAYTTALFWDELQKKKKYLLAILGAMILLALYSAWSRTLRGLLPVGLAVVFYLIIVFGKEKTIGRLQLKQAAMILVIIINILFIYTYNLSEKGGNVINDLLGVQGAKELLSSHEAAMMKEYYEKEDDFFRYDGNHFTNNDAMSSGVNSVNYYWSITNPYDQKFRILLGIRDRLNWQLNGYDQRDVLDTLANVRYYILREGYDDTVPEGFSYREDNGRYRIYENDYFLPFGSTFEKAVSYEDWYDLNSVEKQELLLDAVVIENGTDVWKNTVSLLDYEVSSSDNVHFSKGSIIVEEKNGTITLKPKEDVKQLYLSIDGLEYIDDRGIIEDDHTVAVLKIYNGREDPYYLYHMTLSHRYNFNKHDYVTYLGDETKEITISFSLPGIYTYEDIYLSVIDRNDYVEKISALSDEHLEDVVFGNNKVSGRISLKSDKYMLLSIPYSKGWKAYVDGKETAVLKADEHYLALPLKAGEHQVELVYMTPGLKAGAVISSLAAIIYIASLFKRRRGV